MSTHGLSSFQKKNIKSKIKPFIAGIITFEVMKAGYG